MHQVQLGTRVQDGPAAGQSVAHVHVHCLPRYYKDLESNDEVYDIVDEAERYEALARRCDSVACRACTPRKPGKTAHRLVATLEAQLCGMAINQILYNAVAQQGKGGCAHLHACTLSSRRCPR